MVFGTFDILHQGHLNFFKQARQKIGESAKKHGKKLIVVVARDVNVKKIKGRRPKFSERIRLKNIKKIKIVDKAVLGDIKDYFQVIKKEKPNVICLGYDQRMRVLQLKARLKKLGLKMKIFRLKPYKPQIYKSSKLKIK
jgi:FAD synthetase